VAEAMYYTAHLRGLTRLDAIRERDHLLERWQIGSWRRQTGSQLSGGQRRLVQLTVAMAGSPPVGILDEPTNGASFGGRSRTVRLAGPRGRDRRGARSRDSGQHTSGPEGDKGEEVMLTHIVRRFTPFAEVEVEVIARISLDPSTGKVTIEGEGGSLWHDYDEREKDLSDEERFKMFPFHFVGASFISVQTVDEDE